jgi:hypothetical protein
MKCNQLGGACDQEFLGETFDEIAEQSKQHGIAMMNAQDQEHIDAMNNMRELMSDPRAFESWFADKKEYFDRLEHM